jgi:hypothetical protein
MAENRGGYRPTAPQNNYNVSATGGNGNKGTQAPRYIPGLPFGQGKQTLQQQGQAPMAGNPSPVPNMPQGQGAPASMQPVVPLTEPTQRPNEPVTAGIDMGPGPGSEVIRSAPTAQNQGLINSLNLLNQLGDNASNQVKSIRNALAAHLSNQTQG